ncbi:MAG: extracellular solute-binding protein [Patescibacteria group bacterium]
MTKKNALLIIPIVLVLSAIIVFEVSGYANYEPVKNIISKKEDPVKVTLEFWGVWDNSDSWQSIIDKYENETHSWNGKEVQVKVNYTKRDIAPYETDIAAAYDGNKSPSIFLINNYWLERYAGKLEPLTDSMANVDKYELLKYEDLEGIFPPYVLQDVFYGDNKMYALPVYSDSLALYYNKDLFQKAGIENPPATWDELKAAVKKLTITDSKNQITQSGIALGSGKNVNRSCDIFSLLTLQGGGKVVDSQGNIDFNKKVSLQTSTGAVEREPGLTALQFYMDFSDTNKEVYAWNNTLTDSLKDFAEGKTAMLFGYAYQKANLLALKPELNYGIAPAPQLPDSTQIALSNVWFPVVSNQNSCKIEGDAKDINCAQAAWSFLSFAGKKENIIEYLNATGKASARTDLSAEQAVKDDKVSAFAKQTSIARGYNKFDDGIDGILTEMLDQTYNDRANWKAQADAAAAKIEELKKK